MNKKYLTWAMIVLAMTITYYVWMIHAWINLDNTEIKRDLTSNGHGENNHSSPFDDFDIDAYNAKINATKHGVPPPRDAFWIMRPKYKCDSFLKINVSKEASYVVKVVDPYDGEVILMYYLPAGDSQEINIPVGTFEIRYTSGTEWFGENKMFGNKGSYAKADRLFTFGRDSGYVLTLYRVPHGNLHTSSMKKEDF